MSLSLQNLFKSLTETGVDATYGTHKRRRTILSNYIALTLVVANLIIYIIVPQNLSVGALSEIVLSSLIFGFPIVLNAYKFTRLSVMYLCWVPPVLTTLFLILGMKETEYVPVSSYDGLRIYLLGISCIPYLLLDTKKPHWFAIGMFPSFVTIFFCDWILNQAGVGPALKGINLEGYEFTPIRTAIAYVVISGSCISLKVILERTDALNESLILELKEKNKIIQEQSDNEVNQLNKRLYANLEELVKREFVLNKAQQIAKLGSWEYRTKEGKFYWTDEMYNIFGVDKSIDLSSPDLSRTLFGEAAVIVEDAFQKLLESYQVYDYTLTIKTPLGYTKWVRVFGFPIFEKNDLVSLNGIVHDITVYKQSQALLEASERKYRSLFEQASDAIMITDFKGNFLDVNQSFCRMIGYSKEEVMKINVIQLLEPDQLKSSPIHIEDLLVGTELVRERQMIHKDGSIIHVESSARRFGDNSIMAIARDITQRKQIEKEKERANHLLNERIKELTALFTASQILNQEDADFSVLAKDLLAMMPAGWQYPDICAARISVYDLEFKTDNFVSTPHSLRSDLTLDNQFIGFIEVVYLEEKPDEDEGPFMEEERNLLESIADLLLLHIGRNQEEEALLKSEANLKATINNTEILIWSVDRNLDLLMYNEPFFNYVKNRYDKELKIGERVLYSVAPEQVSDVHKRWDQHYLRALAGEVVKLEVYDLGEYYRYSLSPIIEREQIIGVSVFAENITEQKLIEDEINRSRANLYATVNNTDTLIWSIDPDFNVITCNDAFREYVRQVYKREVKLGGRVLPDGPITEVEVNLMEEWIPRYTRALSGESFKILDEDNGSYFNISLNPILNNEDKVIGASVFVEDVTERVVRERELAEANKKIGEMRLMALRSAMNPHFIFNALNSIQYFISRNDRLNAINYLSTFSKLIRGILNSSVQQKISLAEELELLQYYIRIEQLRFENNFEFLLHVDPALDLESVEVPSLLIQPYVENAILHGLYNKQGDGKLTISVSKTDSEVLFEILDNGVGREAAARIQSENFPRHKSVAMALTAERLGLINENENISFEIQDLFHDGVPSGTCVKISIKV